MKAAIINVTGYAGAELARILAGHPELDIAAVTGRSAAGRRLAEIFPHLSALDLTICESFDGQADIVFSALPHAASAEKVVPLIEGGMRVVDFSADFRLRDPREYSEWYRVEHPSPQHLAGAVYGLPELNRREVGGASIVANPGCYPTAAILALAPAVAGGLITGDVIVDAKSGVSGAGRAPTTATNYSEVTDSIRAYSVSGHRHLPEIAQELGRISRGTDLKVTLLTHLVPMTRGILVSCYAPLNGDVAGSGDVAMEQVTACYERHYRDEPFIEVVSEPPSTKQTQGSNRCLIYPTVDRRTDRLVVIACIDNLVKGAAGQAVQNANLMLGLPETAGLQQLPLYP